MAASASEAQPAVECARAAAKHLGLAIEGRRPDDNDLEGAQGLLDRQFRTVLVRNDLQDPELAIIIAHEIGHFVVHDGPSPGYHPRSEKNGGDPTQRIVTYGIKERREAQANSFGREFLLPRPLAKRLFLEGRLASGIARDLRLPYDMVLQQMADGLLLPDLPPPVEEPARPDQGCDASQRRAVEHRDTPFLLRAGPGTGKTRTLTERIVWLLEQGVAPSGILALTFSNKAAQELTERVQTAVGPKAVNIWTGTFHAFGLDTIRRHHALFGVSDDPRVIGPSDGVAMLEEALPALDVVHYLNLSEPALALRDILRAIGRAKDELCTSEDYARLAQAMGEAAVTEEDRLAAAKAREVAVVYEHYQSQLMKEGFIDYGDLIMRPTLKMREDPDFRDALRARFTHVHVDEYQDINRASAMLVKEIVGDGERLWVVGDARQSIYRFRGASAANIARFEADYPKGRRDGLEMNYRSTEEVVSLYTSFGGTMSVSAFAGSAALGAARGVGGERPTLTRTADAGGEMDRLAGSIRELEGAGLRLSEQAVLARSNGALAHVAEELEARDIPVLYLGPFFERPEVRDLLSLLSILAEDAGPGLLRVAALPEYGVALEDALGVVREARAKQVRVIDLLRRLETIGFLSPTGRSGLAALAGHLVGMHRGTTPWLALCRFLFDGSNYFRTVLAGQSPSDAMRRVAVRQLIEAMRLMPPAGTGTPVRRALDRVRHMMLLADERDFRQLPSELDGLEGVRLMTVHASKGLEFEAVHLPGLYAGAVPAANRPPACLPPTGMIKPEDQDAHEAEEECVLFVAMSRARSYLRLYRPATRGGRTSNPSRFLERVPALDGAASPTIGRSRPLPARSAITAPTAAPQLSAADIEAYARCPRRFFYSRVLGLSGSTRTGAYLDALGCLQSVLAYVRQSQGTPYSRERAQAIFDEAWRASDLAGHPFARSYRMLTLRMLERVHTAAEGGTRAAESLSTMIGREAVAMQVDRVVQNGAETIVRTIRSGRLSKSDPDRLGATLLLKALKETYGPRARLENHYLQDGKVAAIEQTSAKRAKRVTDCETAIVDIRRGRFDALPNDLVCPRCAFLFVCATPDNPTPA